MSKDNINSVLKRVKLASKKANRDPEEIRLICVTKGVDPYRINEAVIAGMRDIGENRVQEAIQKKSEVMPGVKWHLIGHLQTNKVKDAIGIFDIIHSLDSLKLARKIDKEARLSGKTVNVLVQVNTSGEETKYGISSEGVPGFLSEIAKLERLRVQGLMTITPLTQNPEAVRPYLRKLKELFDSVKNGQYAGNIEMRYLSMGMSQDFEVAIEEGSNMLRIGRAIFGAK